MPEPLITVLIPCFKCGPWIAEAIISAAVQDYPNKRIIVVDDASPDDSIGQALSTMDKVNEAEGQLDVKAYWGKVRGTDATCMVQCLPNNHGCPFARNWGLLATYDDTDAYILLDADDYFLPGKIRRSVEVWQSSPEIGVVATDYYTLKTSGLMTRVWVEPFDRNRLIVDNIIPQHSFISKDVLDQVGNFDVTLDVCEDYDIWLRATEYFCAYHIPEALVVKRVGDHDMTHTVSSFKWQRDYAKVKTKLRERSHQNHR